MVKALVDLVNGVTSLGPHQESWASILRYMTLALEYDIRYVIVGQSPYPSHLVPYLGSAYSQTHGTSDTPTTQIIVEHFVSVYGQHVQNVRHMLRENWRLLECGYLFVNSNYSLKTAGCPVEQLEVYDRMVDYICTACTLNKSHESSGAIRIVALGTTAHHIAVSVSSRLRSMGLESTATLDGQPARFNRLTHGRDKVGRCKAYSCLSPSTMEMFVRAANDWKSVQGSTSCADLLNRMSTPQQPKLSTVFMANIGDLIEDISVHMNNAPEIPTDPKDVTPDMTISMLKYSQRSTQLLYSLTCVLAADTAVKQTISEKVVASAAANAQFKRVTSSVVTSGIQRPLQSSTTSISSVPSSLGVTSAGVSTPSATRISDRFNSLSSSVKKRGVAKPPTTVPAPRTPEPSKARPAQTSTGGSTPSRFARLSRSSPTVTNTPSETKSTPRKSLFATLPRTNI